MANGTSKSNSAQSAGTRAIPIRNTFRTLAGAVSRRKPLAFRGSFAGYFRAIAILSHLPEVPSA